MQEQRVKLATVAILGLVLAAGFLMGAAWDRRLVAEEGEAAPPDSTTVVEPRSRRRTPVYMRVNPALSDEQLASVEEIMARRREAARALFAEARIDSLYDVMKEAERTFRAEYDPRFDALIEGSRVAIRQVMTPEQAVQYDSLIADSDRRRWAEGAGGPN